MDAPAITREVKDLDPTLTDRHKELRAAVVMLSTLEVGFSPKTLSHFTGYKIKEVHKFMDSLQKNGILKDGILYVNWFENGEEGIVSFWCDVLCAVGSIKRCDETIQNN